MVPNKYRVSFGLFLIVVVFAEQVFAEDLRCGIRGQEKSSDHRKKRVVGGSEAEKNSWPWIVNFIGDKSKMQQCAGSIIDNEWILTAAHCFLYGEKPLPLTGLSYHISDHNLNETDQGEYTVEPSAVFIHPDFVLAEYVRPGDYDIALIKLKTPLNYTSLARPVCLPEQTTKFTKNDTCYVIGWGNYKDTWNYFRSPHLKQANVQLVSLEQCNSNVSYKGNVPDTFVCAGFKEGGIDGCNGDSGGPLQCERNGTWLQLGITIWGMGCAQPNHYGVYLDVRKLLPFIKAIQKGPNINLTTFYETSSLMDIKHNKTINLISLHDLLTKNQHFSDIDLVRNLQLEPREIKIMKTKTLMDLEFVSEKVFKNTTKLLNVTQVIVTQAYRLRVYQNIKTVASKLNITIDEVLRLSNLTKDDLLNSKFRKLIQVQKHYYVNVYLTKLSDYKKMLLTYSDAVIIHLNMEKVEKDIKRMPLYILEKWEDKDIKQRLVKYNMKVFTEVITLRNISSFFGIELTNMTVVEVIQDILYINYGYFASLHMFNQEDLKPMKFQRIFDFPNANDLTLVSLAKIFLHAEFSLCGVQNKSQNSHHRVRRVVGGTEAEQNSWPWIVNIIGKDKQQCGGSIIGREWILTAAHCFLYAETPFPINNYSYHVADHNLNSTDRGEYLIEPSHAYFHPKYYIGTDNDPGDYDIALLKLKKPLSFDRVVRSVCLPKQTSKFSKDDNCYVTGWGNDVDTSLYHRSPYLKQAKVDLVSLEKCNGNSSYKGNIPESFICAGFKEGRVDSCSGDSGGPLQCERNGTWTQLGMVIWGIGCAQPSHYGVYLDIRKFLPFISIIQSGPNANLTRFLKKSLMLIKPDMEERSKLYLHRLLTKNMTFSYFDLVRNFQLIPDQIKTLEKSTLVDLMFVSNMTDILENATTLNNITHTFLQQWKRLRVYYKSKEMATELNITFDKIVKISKRQINDFLNSKFQALEKLMKMYYINGHLTQLQDCKKTLLLYNKAIAININKTAIVEYFNEFKKISALKTFGEISLKKLLVGENTKEFIYSITFQNITTFFKLDSNKAASMTVLEILGKALGISASEYIDMKKLAEEQLAVLRQNKIKSVVRNPELMTLSEITDAILQYQGSDQCKENNCPRFSTCQNLVAAFFCRCDQGYIGNGNECRTGNAIYEWEIRTDHTFIKLFNNSKSNEYRNFVSLVENAITESIRRSKKFRGFIGTQVTSLRKGSVVATFVLVFNLGENDKVNTSLLQSVITKVKQIDHKNVSLFKTPPKKTDLCKLGSHRCHKDADCLAGNDFYTCRCRKNFFGDGVMKCIDPCADKYCGAHSHCSRNLVGVAKCICDLDYSKDEDGNCKKNYELKIPFIVVCCIAGVFLLVFLVILCSKYLRTTKQKTVEITPPPPNMENRGTSNTGYDNIVLGEIKS